MPNIVTHFVITSEVMHEASPDLLLGSALPDFVGMARDMQGSEARNADFSAIPGFRDGIQLHQRTDVAFEGQKRWLSLVADARRDLSSIKGLPRLAVRACADPGSEILLDGILLEQTGGQAIYDQLREEVIGEETSVEKIEDIHLRNTIKYYFWDKRPDMYKDPDQVADIMYRRLAARKGGNAAFDPALIPNIADAFELQRARLRLNSGALLANTIEKMKPLAD